MWVAEQARGLGLGRRLLAELERQAVEAGCDTIRLETNRALAEAIALYRASGYEAKAAKERDASRAARGTSAGASYA